MAEHQLLGRLVAGWATNSVIIRPEPGVRLDRKMRVTASNYPDPLRGRFGAAYVKDAWITLEFENPMSENIKALGEGDYVFRSEEPCTRCMCWKCESERASLKK